MFRLTIKVDRRPWIRRRTSLYKPSNCLLVTSRHAQNHRPYAAVSLPCLQNGTVYNHKVPLIPIYSDVPIKGTLSH